MRLALASLLLVAVATAAADPLHDPAAVRDRVRVTNYGRHALVVTELLASGHRDQDAAAEVYPVTELTADAARLLIEHDDARLLLWVARDDLAWTVARTTRIAGHDGAGVWLRPGAPVTIAGSGRRVSVRYHGDDFTLDGTVLRRALTQRYRPRSPRVHADRNARRFAREPDGPALVEASMPLPVRVVSRGRGGWVVIEYADAEVRIVGWARETEVGTDELGTLGARGGIRHGITDTDRVTLEPGTCLTADDGAVVGVQLTRQTRYASELGGGRWSVYIDTPWGLVSATAVDLGGGGSATPRWRKC